MARAMARAMARVAERVLGSTKHRRKVGRALANVGHHRALRHSQSG